MDIEAMLARDFSVDEYGHILDDAGGEWRGEDGQCVRLKPRRLTNKKLEADAKVISRYIPLDDLEQAMENALWARGSDLFNVERQDILAVILRARQLQS
jgi:hypothetical protein